MNNRVTRHKKIMALISVVLVLVLTAFDQFTKWLAVTRLKGNDAFVIIPKVFELRYLENRGVAFGMFQGQKWPILLTSALLMTAILYLIIRMPKGLRFDIFQIILVFIFAGGVGNMIDRFFLGYVVDFFYFVLIDFPIFNVADCYVVCATIALCILMFFGMNEEDLDFISFKKRENKQEQ